MLLFATSMVMAAAPTVGLPTISPTYTNDLNYFDNPFSISATASGDVNGDSVCWYFISTGGTPIAGDFNSDTNVCSKTGITVAGNDDFNFSVIVQNTVGDANGTSPTAFYYRDSNAPTTALTRVSGNPTTITLTCTDTATNTGNGAGCKSIRYWINGGAEQTISAASGSFTISTPGNNTVEYCSYDNLDNNGCATLIASSTFYVGDITSSACTILNLVFIVVAALVLVGVVVFGLAAGLDAKQIIPIVIMAIIVIIAIIIMGEVLSTSCSIA